VSPAARLALHTWTLDTTPLPDAVAAARAAGWDGIELRRLDYNRGRDAGRDAAWVEDTVRRSGLPVACVGVEFGWLWADGAERARLLSVFDEQCARAKALGCATVMSPVDKGSGDVARAAASVREVGDIAARHGVRLAVEFNSQCDQLNTLERLRDVLAKAAHPSCGLLFDAYHMQRSGGAPRPPRGVRGDESGFAPFRAGARGTAGAAEDQRSFGHGCPWRNEDGNWSGAWLSVHAC